MKVATWSYIICSVVVLLIVAASIILARRPYYNWDMFPYMALAMEQSDRPFKETHQEVYGASKEIMPPSDFDAISSRQPELMKDAQAFEAILPYFQIKPGYNLLVSVFYKLGVHPLTATWLPSNLSYLAIGLMLFFWMRRTGPIIIATMLSLLVIATPVMTNLARYSSPDMMCAALTLAALLFILTSHTTAGLSMLTAVVTVRPDAAILGILIIGALWLSKRIILLQAMVWVGAQLGVLYFEFQDSALISEYLVLDLGLLERLTLYASHPASILRSIILPMLAAAIAAIFLRKKLKLFELHSLLALAALLSIIARFILHPYIEDRFNLPSYLVVLVILWVTVSSRYFTLGGLKPESNSTI